MGRGIVPIPRAFSPWLLSSRRHWVIPPPAPPVRRMDPVAAGPPAETATTEASPSKPEVAPEPALAEPKPEPELELPAPTEELELPAPAETLELPAPAETTPIDEEDP